MYCINCGEEIRDGNRFCPHCGAGVYSQQAQDERNSITDFQEQKKGSSSQTAGDEGRDLLDFVSDISDPRECLKPEKLERFAPVSALFPAAMMVLLFVFRIIVGSVFRIIYGVTFNYSVWTIYDLFYTVIKIVFCAGAAGCTGALIYVAVTKKDMGRTSTWIAPLASLLALFSCIGQAAGASGVLRLLLVISGLAAVILGAELVARITIAGKPMDSSMQFQEVPAVYGNLFSRLKNGFDSGAEQMTAEKESEFYGNSTSAAVSNSYFDGTGLECLGNMLLMLLVSCITCGIGTPWMICRQYKWKVEHTVIDGKRLTFNGTGAELLGKWILWYILTAVTCGIFGFFQHVRLRKWQMQHTYFEGTVMQPGEMVSDFDGSTLGYMGCSLLAGLINTFTLGIGMPWTSCMLERWDAKHRIVSGQRLEFSGKGLAFLGQCLINILLSAVTCGIYAPWAMTRMNRYFAKNTHIDPAVQMDSRWNCQYPDCL